MCQVILRSQLEGENNQKKSALKSCYNPFPSTMVSLMRRILIPVFAILFLLESLPLNRSTAAAQSASIPTVEPDSGSVVCPPGVYKPAPDGCLALGPSETLAKIAETGIPYPALPLPAYTPSADLNDIPYRYFKVNNDGAALYSSLDEAASNQPSSHIDAGSEIYVSYVGSETDQNGTSYYLLRSGYLIGMDGGRVGVPTFQGLAFSSQPQRPFGWVMGETRLRTAPGLNEPYTGTKLISIQYRADLRYARCQRHYMEPGGAE